MKVRIGTRVGDLFSECGGFTGKPKRIASGSPLLGRQINSMDEPVIKTSYAVFALLEGFRPMRHSGCISCGECRHVCPVGLDPEELYKKILIDSGGVSSRKGVSPCKGEDISAGRARECHGCGCCEIVCPSRFPLSAAITDSAGGKS
jgi:electron transport complex protein RnfC